MLSVICPEALGFTDISSLNEIQVTLQDTPTSSRLASLEDTGAQKMHGTCIHFTYFGESISISISPIKISHLILYETKK